LFSIIQAAGWPIWPLIASSVLALALVIERFISLKAQRIAPPKLLDEVLAVARYAVPAPDVVSKLEQNSVLGEVLASGLRALNLNPRCSEDELRAIMESAGRLAAHRAGALPQRAGHHCIGSTVDGSVWHGGRHDRDFWFTDALWGHRWQPGPAGARHLGGAVQHRIRLIVAIPVADFLALFPCPG
jgi:hypothetical protein